MALIAQKIFELCPNYDNIVNYKFNRKDIMSKELIDFYENSVFNCDIKNKEQVDQLIELDMIMNLFVQNLRFNEYLKDAISSISDLDMGVYTDLIYYIIDSYNKYEDKCEIKTSRWI